MSRVAIVRYELRRLLRDGALPTLLIVFLGLAGYAAWSGADWVRQREAAVEAVGAQERDHLAWGRRFVETQPMVTTRWLPTLPPGPMAAVSVGQAEAYPFAADVIPLFDAQIFARLSTDIGNPTTRAAGRFDLAFVIVFILPLILLAATYDLWTRERERGVAAMLLSQPIAIGSLIGAKALARGAVVLAPATMIIVGVAAFAGARDPSGLIALTCVVLAYGGFWLALAVVISHLARRSAEAAVAAGSVWLFVVIMAPALALAVIDLAAPAPSEILHAANFKARSMEIAETQRGLREDNTTATASQALRIPDRLRQAMDDRLAADRALAPLLEAHRYAKASRRRLLDVARFGLPSVAVQDALDRISGSEADRALAFQDQTLHFRSERQRAAQLRLEADAPLTLEEFDHRAPFVFREGGGPFQRGVLADLAALIGAAALLLLAARAFRGRVTTP